MQDQWLGVIHIDDDCISQCLTRKAEPVGDTHYRDLFQVIGLYDCGG